MRAWLLAHQTALQFYLVLGAFAAVALWESFRPLRVPASATSRRWFTNFALAALGVALTRACLPLAGVAVAVIAEQRGWGLLGVLSAPFWLAFVAAVLALDVSQYALHRLLHAVPILWRLHKIHHAELDVDCVTAIRHHPLEFLLTSGAELAVIAVLGAPPLAVLAASLLSAATSFFNHANVGLTPAIDRALRRFVVTPDMHRIHHSVRHDEGNANFAMVFPWWDRLFGTWCESPGMGRLQMSFGVADARTPEDVALLGSLVMPFRRERVTAPA